jgi:hypothetical protein
MVKITSISDLGRVSLGLILVWILLYILLNLFDTCEIDSPSSLLSDLNYVI